MSKIFLDMQRDQYKEMVSSYFKDQEYEFKYTKKEAKAIKIKKE